MESFLKADQKDRKPEIVTPPADNLCNLCHGTDRGLYGKVFGESEDAEAEISDEAKKNKGLPCGVKPSGNFKLKNTTEHTCHLDHGANILCLEKDNHTHTIRMKRKK